jgi:hypothetical protein
MTAERLTQLKARCHELQNGAALFLLSTDISPSMIRMSTEVSARARTLILSLTWHPLQLPYVATQLFNKFGVSIGLASMQASERCNKENGQTLKRTNQHLTPDDNSLHQCMQKLHVSKIDKVRRKGFTNEPRKNKYELEDDAVGSAL